MSHTMRVGAAALAWIVGGMLFAGLIPSSFGQSKTVTTTAVQTITGAKTFSSSKLCVAGLTNGSGCIIPPATGPTATTWTLPPGPATLAAVGSGSSGYAPNQLLSGGGVALTTGYTYLVSAASYIILNTTYISPESSVTLTAAHGSLDRIDVIAVDNTGTVVVIDGTAAGSPAKPDIDPTTQLELTFVYVVAASSTSATTTTTNVYLENTEWTSSKSGAPIELASTSNPYAGTVDIEGTSAVANNYFQLAAPSPIDGSSVNNLILHIRSKAAWPNGKALSMRWQLAGVVKGFAVTLNSGSFGFNSSTTGTYQQIVVPMSNFGVSGLSIDQIRFTVAGGGAAIGFYVDNIQLQGGVTLTTPPNSLMAFKGAWSATTSYVANDVVTSGSTSYVALQSNINVTPVAGVNWAILASTVATPVTVTNGGTGVNTLTTAYGLLAAGTTATGTVQTLAAGATTTVLVGGGASALPVWTTATGTGAPVREGSPTFTGTATFAAITATGVVSDAIGDLRRMPQNSRSAAYTFAATDCGKHILHPSADTTARTFTIDSNANVPIAIDCMITIINQNAAGVITLAITSDTMRLAGAGTTGSRTIAANCIVTFVKITSTEWIVNGGSCLTLNDGPPTDWLRMVPANDALYEKVA